MYLVYFYSDVTMRKLTRLIIVQKAYNADDALSQASSALRVDDPEAIVERFKIVAVTDAAQIVSVD